MKQKTVDKAASLIFLNGITIKWNKNAAQNTEKKKKIEHVENNKWENRINVQRKRKMLESKYKKVSENRNILLLNVDTQRVVNKKWGFKNNNKKMN